MDLGQLGYAFINTAGIGGIVVLSVYTGALVIYFFLTRWILRGAPKKAGTQSLASASGKTKIES